MSVTDYQMPPLSTADLAIIQKALTELPKHWLIHCSAGIGRTGPRLNPFGITCQVSRISLEQINCCYS